MRKFRPAATKLNAERGRADEGKFVGLAVQQLGAESACVGEPVHDEGFLVAEHATVGAIADGLRNATRQRADAGVAEKDFVRA